MGQRVGAQCIGPVTIGSDNKRAELADDRAAGRHVDKGAVLVLDPHHRNRINRCNVKRTDRRIDNLSFVNGAAFVADGRR